MFRHSEGGDQSQKPVEGQPLVPEATSTPKAEPVKDTSPLALRELLEKNLKWSQIIYEQNRKINNKLLWSAIAEWLRLFIILVPLAIVIWGAWAFLPQIKNVYSQYNELLQLSPTSLNSGSNSSVQDLIKLLPLNPSQQEQLKGMLAK